jgi:putative transferase (TIGR04331 family)
MKYNFVISDYRGLWLEGARHLYILEPYVHYRLERTGNISDYDDIIVAPYRRKTSSDLQKDHDFVRCKFEKYVSILTERLNTIHGTNRSLLFWRRALSISFERYITFFHEVFKNCELYFKADSHYCNVLSEKSYCIPLDFEEQRYLFQHSDYGQEQIFSIYMHLFYPEGLKTKDAEFRKSSSAGVEKEHYIKRILRQKISKATLEKVKTRVVEKIYSRKAHKIGVMGSFFSTENLRLLMTKSKGAIYPLKPEVNLDNLAYGPLATDRRKYLSEATPDFDRFDLFFFESIKHCFPRIFVENFKRVENYYIAYLDQYRDLEFVTSEAWLSCSSLTIALALLKERSVKHIYNEHNYFEHPWVGSLFPTEASLVDIYVSLGWGAANIPNLVEGASLMGFKLNEVHRKINKICYVSSGATSKRPNYTASYGWACENAPKYFNFVKLFLEGLTAKTRDEILYRGYPVLNYEDWLAYDQDFMLYPLLNNMRKNNDMSVSGKLIMLQSELVVVDYISTAYLEAMIMNIPTIFFWNPDACYLNKDNAGFFDSLISVGICQTDPVKAAIFVESVKDDPQQWWTGEGVQKAKDDFLLKNMGRPEAMIDYLMGLLEPNDIQD